VTDDQPTDDRARILAESGELRPDFLYVME
jgi:hypothetical protein